jgi:TPR repeat protein
MPEGTRRSWAWQRLVPALALAALSAWAAQPQPGPLPNPISAPGAPWGFDGFTVNAPADDGWTSLAKDAHYAELTKEFAAGVQASAIVDARRVDNDVPGNAQLLALLRETQTAVPSPAMKLAGYSAESFAANDATCARFSVKFDDRRPNHPAPEALIARGASCVRQSMPGMVITLKYVQRGAAADLVPEVSRVGDPFLASLRFAASDPSLLRKARVAAGQTPEESIQLLTPEAERGDGEAALLLGDMYLYGRGVPRDYQTARRWLEMAAKDGRSQAFFNLGAIYDKALGVDRDASQAIKWFTLAADQRDPDAQLNLALFYIKGDGVPKNVATAEQWLERAANNGNTRARRILTEGKYKQL